MISAYKEIINKSHHEDILVYDATLTPFGDSSYDSPEREKARQKINEWIRNSGRFDTIIDLDKALRDPNNPRNLLPEADTDDNLHPNETGYRLIAEAIDLSLFVSKQNVHESN